MNNTVSFFLSPHRFIQHVFDQTWMSPMNKYKKIVWVYQRLNQNMCWYNLYIYIPCKCYETLLIFWSVLVFLFETRQSTCLYTHGLIWCEVIIVTSATDPQNNSAFREFRIPVNSVPIWFRSTQLHDIFTWNDRHNLAIDPTTKLL